MYLLAVAWAAERGPHTRAFDAFLRFVLTWWSDNMNHSRHPAAEQIQRYG
jgi:hypothetical protein